MVFAFLVVVVFFLACQLSPRTVMMIIPLPIRGATGGRGGGGQVPPYDFRFCFFLVVSSAVGHGHDSTPTPLLIFFGQIVGSRTRAGAIPQRDILPGLCASAPL